jgi:hypothetical protein
MSRPNMQKRPVVAPRAATTVANFWMMRVALSLKPRRVELAAALALRPREAAEKIFVDPAEHVPRLVSRFAHGNAGDEVDQLAEHHLVERRSVIILGLRRGVGSTGISPSPTSTSI